MAVEAPRIALRFLLKPAQRQRMMRSNFSESRLINESGAFYRLWDLFCTLQDAGASDLLDAQGQKAYSAFKMAMQSMPWETIESHPHIKQLSDGNLSKLVQPGKALDRELGRIAWKLMTWRARVGKVFYSATHLFE